MANLSRFCGLDASGVLKCGDRIFVLGSFQMFSVDTDENGWLSRCSPWRRRSGIMNLRCAPGELARWVHRTVSVVMPFLDQDVSDFQKTECGSRLILSSCARFGSIPMDVFSSRHFILLSLHRGINVLKPLRHLVRQNRKRGQWSARRRR